MDATEAFKAQIRFLELLKLLTDAGRVEWLKANFDPGFVYCLVDGDDLIKFECRGGEKGDRPVPPTQPLAGVAAYHCNTTYLWLSGLANWELLLQLLQSAKADEERFRQCARIAHKAPVKVLEARLKL